MKALLDIVHAHKAGQRRGIYSLCSAHPAVIEAALIEARRRGEFLLIEATSNQVNQFGGYTGMQPTNFHRFVMDIASRVGFAQERVLLGGDHLGPNAWQKSPAIEAMKHAGDMVEGYVRAGFRKIHLDCSMACADDRGPLNDDVVASRAAKLAAIAENAWSESGGEAPLYVIGTEVPTPGGAHEELTTLQATPPEAVDITLEAHRQAFRAAGLDAAWSRVIALVVQPGVEFDHDKVIDYDPQAAVDLSKHIEGNAQLVFEAHSTDYQAPQALAALVRDHFAILKVGPGVTFALRETLWALADLARDFLGDAAVPLKRVVLNTMQANPRYWQSYYTDASRRQFDLQFSLSDRIRYYWTEEPVRRACAQLLKQLGGKALPFSLLSQYLPQQFAMVRAGTLQNEVQALLFDGVAQVLRHYAEACNPQGAASIDGVSTNFGAPAV
ncbi:MAG TPA: D-tagatose-bisphosphate aldolase, class II, non-catalytic subunit [Steroidobacteraceae bacterium]|jgi:D-tagatose-1,6-bisphosphate aldolase subunit GatZ/KbaZ